MTWWAGNRVKENFETIIDDLKEIIDLAEEYNKDNSKDELIIFVKEILNKSYMAQAYSENLDFDMYDPK